MVDVVRLPVAEPEPEGDFCRTATAERIIDVLKVCHGFGEMAMIVGEPGLGKTTALEYFEAETPGSWLITASPAAGALVPCLSRIAVAVAGRAPNTGALAVVETINYALKWHRDGKLIMIDEAQHLGDAAIEELRSLHDATGVGVVLCGNRTLLSRFEVRSASRRSVWAQLSSRLLAPVELSQCDPADLAALCRHHAVAGERSRKLLEKQARRRGALRHVDKAIAIARKLAGEGPIQPHHIQQAVELRGGAA